MVLHDVADFEDRRQFLESLKDRLEALVAPKLIAAFNSHSSGTCLPAYYPKATFTILYPIKLYDIILVIVNVAKVLHLLLY